MTDNKNNKVPIAEGIYLSAPCEKHLDKTTKLERDVAVIKDRLDDIKDIKTSIKGIEAHMATAGHYIPQMESQIGTLQVAVGELRETLAGLAGRHKVIYGILATVGSGVVALALKMFVGA